MDSGVACGAKRPWRNDGQIARKAVDADIQEAAYQEAGKRSDQNMQQGGLRQEPSDNKQAFPESDFPAKRTQPLSQARPV